MHEAPAGTAARRDLADGSYTLALLAVAILTGYGLLAPDRLGAATYAARIRPPRAVAPVGPASERPAPSVTAAAVTSTGEAPAPSALPASPAELGVAPPHEPMGEVAPARPAAPAQPASETARPEPAPRITWPETVSGRVLDDRRQPVAGASIVVAGREIRSDAEGSFTVTPPPDAPLLVKLPGFAKVTVEPTRGPVQVVLRPQVIKAAYLTYFGVGDRGIRSRVLDLVARTELNAVVIDVKGDRGWLLYPTTVELAQQAGARGPATLREFDALMADLKARGIYTIARIVTFKDNVLANHRPEWAVIDTRTGKPWIDREKLAWVDPFREEVWAYNIAIGREAIARGFDEIQYDYVRFPTDGKLAAARYSRPVSKETRLPTITGFLERARQELGRHGAFVSADIFGYTAFNENDTDIGQRIEELAPHVDFLSPMVYPSGYHVGIPGFRNPVANSYHVVRESVRLIRKRSNGSVVRVRPWLQDFRDYAFDRRIFGVAEIRDQIRGTDEGGGTGWMLWNPRNDYTAAALRSKGSLAAR